MEHTDKLVAVDVVCAELGISPARLYGLMARNKPGVDPIGDKDHVYEFSLAELRKRLADQPAVVTP